MAITFNTADVKFSLRNRIALRGFIKSQIQKFENSETRKLNLSFVFCSDEYLLNINRQFLQHDYYTDIITFPLSDSEEELEAEIYISVDRVRENAGKFKEQRAKLKRQKAKGKEQNLKSKEDFNGELNRVIFHGVLHLLGFKDKSRANQLEMREMEDEWLKRFNSKTQKAKSKNLKPRDKEQTEKTARPKKQRAKK